MTFVSQCDPRIATMQAEIERLRATRGGKMNRTETVALPAEAFALLIKSAAQAVINELDRPASEVRATFLHEQVGMLDELVGKFEILHRSDR